MIKLTMTEKGGEPKALSFDKDEVTIGRVSGNDIVLPKGNVSKRHSRLTLKDGRIEIADLKSTNGTYVNGKKIGEATMVGATDRVYVGDFLITIDGLGGEVASHSRRMPPPPPPPRSGSSSAIKLPDPNESTNTGAGQDEGDEEDLGLAAKPPRAGRMPPPPPPPPRRPPTPISSPALDDDGLGGDLAAPSPAELSAADDSTNNVGLFERRKTADHATFEGGAAQRPTTGSRPAPLPSEPAPLPAVPGQAAAAASDFLSAAAEATGATTGEGLESLLTDPAVLQVIIAGPDATYVDRGAGPVAYAPGLGDPNAVADTLWRLANSAVPPPSPDSPIVDVRFPDGTRLAAVFPPASPSGVVGSIRRPSAGERALVDLVPPGAKDVQTLLEAAVAGQRNLLLTGDASALPVLAAALAALIPTERRVVSIGAAAARPRAGWTDLQATSDLSALVRVAATFRADHLLVADAVGPEVAELLLAAARGQEGLLVAAPARAVAEGLSRVEALAAPALGGNASVAPLLCSTIDLVVHVVANTDGSARIVDIAEPKVEGGRVAAELVVSWRSDSGRRSGGAGKLQVTGVSARLGAALAAVGQSLPGNLVRR